MKILVAALLCLPISAFCQINNFNFSNSKSSIRQVVPKGVEPQPLLRKDAFGDLGADSSKVAEVDGATIYKSKYHTRWQHLILDLEAIESQIQIENDKYEATLSASNRPDDIERDRHETAIATLESKRNEIEKKTKDAFQSYVTDFIRYRRVNFFMGPTQAKGFYNIIYDGNNKRFRALNNTGLTIGDNSASLFSEVVSATCGVLRIGLGTMVSNSKESDDDAAKEQEAYQRLVTYGGNTVLTLEYPWAYVHSSDNRYNFISRVLAKGTGDIPAFGTSTEKFAASAMVGLDVYLDAATDDNSLRFYGSFNINQVYGSGVFNENLGVSKPRFLFGQLQVGLVFLENFKLSFVVSTFSSEKSLRNKNIVGGGQVLR